MAGGLITYEENGFPVELVSDRDIVRAIRQGKLRRETIVHDYRDDGSVSAGRADEVERLQAYFAAVEAAENAAPSESTALTGGPVPPPSPPESQATADDQPADAETGARADAAAQSKFDTLLGDPTIEETADDGGADPHPPAAGAGAGVLVILGALILVALFVFAALSSRPTDRSGSSGGPAGNEAEAEDPTDVIGVEISYWANREVRVRRGPSVSSAARGSLKRGELVRGIQVRGPSGEGDWIRIEAGQFAGGYAWIKNFSTAERPTLVSSASGTRKLARGQAIYAEPDFASSRLDSAEAGATVRLTGLTASGWWELALDGGGVGYLEPQTAFTGCSGLDCRILTPEGWGEFRAGVTVEAAERAGGIALVRPGHYDEFFADEPDRLRSCNIHAVSGAPSNLGVFVENGIVTSVGVGLGEGGAGARFETDRGIALGDSEEAVRRAYPELEEQPDIYSEPPDKKLFYRRGDGRGIKFGIVEGRVATIDAGGNSINYVEGCL